jgi:hypothetical protein
LKEKKYDSSDYCNNKKMPLCENAKEILNRLKSDWKETDSDTAFLLGLGGQYEFAHRTSALEQWSFRGKLGIVF